jgi:type IV secretory pathway TraG/TraD family ATPase VirD4
MSHEILRLPGERQLALIQSKPHILTDRVKYYADAESGGMFEPNPMPPRS